MLSRTSKLRFRRLMRSRKRQVEDISVQAEEQLEEHFFQRLSRLTNVRRFVAGWLTLFVLLIVAVVLQTASLAQYYQSVKPVPGGVYTEGILGSYTNANPLYAVSSVDSAVASLIFDGLLQYDQQNQLVGALAQNWTVDERGTTYTVTLRPDLRWHDGRPITSEDVVYTYQTIQNPDAKSPLLSNWQGVRVIAVDIRQVSFKLPSVLAAFPHSLTNGIVPKHLLSGIAPGQLRSANFNTTQPVGSGPFKMGAVEVSGDTPETRQQQIALSPNEQYYGGAPKLQQFKIRTFLNEQTMLTSFANQELTGMSGAEGLPKELANAPSTKEYNIPITGQVGAFFKTTESVLQDIKLRQALSHAVDRIGLLRSLAYPAVATNGPLLTSHLGYTKSSVQLPYSVDAATKLLDAAGLKLEADGVRTKDGKPFSVRFVTRDTQEYSATARQLQKDWKAVGVQTELVLQNEDELRGSLEKRDYDVLLYGIALGSDPDVFAYWHSSQAGILSNSRLNFSEYKSANADKALEAGRTRVEPDLRIAKYRPFLDTWRIDAPALMLYQPRYVYVTRGDLYGFDARVVNVATDRYSNVQNWMIREAKVTN